MTEPTPRTDRAVQLTTWEGTSVYELVRADFARNLERELAQAEAARVEAEKERDKHYGRLAGLLWNGAIDNYKAGDLQQWSKDYTAEISALRLALEEIRDELQQTTVELSSSPDKG